MTLTVLHTGQTGVERGAYRAARASELAIDGYCMLHGRDELGTMPGEVRENLHELPKLGSRTAAYATLRGANALVIAIPEAASANDNPGIEALRREARALALPCFLVDLRTNLGELACELRRLEARDGTLRLMVTGPRRTRWPDGERLGWQIVTSLALADALVGSRRRRVLLVEDDPPTAKALSTLVRALGHDCEVVGDGAAALRAVAATPPEVVLLDIKLPDMTGYEVARRLRETQPTSLFLAAITGWEPALDPQAAIAAGFDHFVEKPAPTGTIQALLVVADAALP